MNRLLFCLLGLFLAAAPTSAQNLEDARRGFTTTLTQHFAEGDAPPVPPLGVLRLIAYPSPVGNLAAYISPSPHDGKRHPAIIWLIGGFSNGLGDTPWAPADPDNDQSASAYREAGILMMYPSRRGGNMNPGYHESFYGEVDDILAAKHYLEKLDDVDPSRIYLGGHSTGGTLAILVAETGTRFRAVFAFGPVDEITRYGQDRLTYDITHHKENDLRSPIKWLQGVTSPLFVFAGTEMPDNLASLRLLQKASLNPLIHFYPLQGKTHFSDLAPTNKVIASKILSDTGPVSDITFTPTELGNSAGN